MTEWKLLAQGALDAVKAARAEILTIMKRAYEVQYKTDHSPVTEADIASQAVLIEKLHQVDSTIPVVSEELKTIDYETRLKWPRLWMGWSIRSMEPKNLSGEMENLRLMWH